jgi:hypothetical protein
MWTLTNRVVRSISDLTVGTVIVLVHIALAERENRMSRERLQRQSVDRQAVN